MCTQRCAKSAVNAAYAHIGDKLAVSGPSIGMLIDQDSVAGAVQLPP